MNRDKETTQRERESVQDDASARIGTHTRSSSVPAVIRSYSGTEELTALDPISLNPSRSSEPTATHGRIAINRRVQNSNDLEVKKRILSYLRELESCDEPTRFSTGNISFIAAQGRINPNILGATPLAIGLDDAEYRFAACKRMWDLLGELALREVKLLAGPIPPDDPNARIDEHWIYPVELIYRATAISVPQRLPLVQKLRELFDNTLSCTILFRRDRDAHPLSRVHNIYGAQTLCLRDLEQLIVFGESMSRHLAVLASAAVPGADRWFGVQNDHGVMLISVRDLTLVSAFPLERLGRYVSLSDTLHRSLLAAPP